MPRCDECGSRRVEPAVVEGVSVLACSLCGALQGEPDQVEHARERVEARERGFDPDVYPLVRALERVPTFKIDAASAGRASRSEYPYVFLRVREGGLQDLERLLTTLEMANRTTKRRWVVESSLQHGLLFILRPRFWKAVQDIDERDILEARSDLPVLAQALRRDMDLSFWRGS